MLNMDIAVRAMFGVVVGGVERFYRVVDRFVDGSIDTIRPVWLRLWFSRPLANMVVAIGTWVRGVSLVDGLRMVTVAIRMVHWFHIAIAIVRS